MVGYNMLNKRPHTIRNTTSLLHHLPLVVEVYRVKKHIELFDFHSYQFFENFIKAQFFV